MNANSSYGASWADQWDPEPEYGSETVTKKNGGGGGGGGGATEKYKKKVGEGIGKTKVIASGGMKKMKEGTSLGLHWIKDKYHKTTQKH